MRLLRNLGRRQDQEGRQYLLSLHLWQRSRGGQYLRDEGAETAVRRILPGFEFPEATVGCISKARRQSRDQQPAFNSRAIGRLCGDHDKLRNRFAQMHVDELDGEIEDVFHEPGKVEWRAER